MVYVEDFVCPISTAEWFANLCYCSYMDLTKLDISNVTSIIDMFFAQNIIQYRLN